MSRRFVKVAPLDHSAIGNIAMQKNSGLKRIILATGYSIQGLKSAFKYEAAFRQELLLAAILIPLACYLDVSQVERILLIAPVILVIIIEIINSAIEAVVDRIGSEKHELSGRAKDQGSAAVLIALLLTAYIWIEILFLA
ncbi:diacylglycerol kinase [Psychromonas marina]|uniref:Diacylglycerol kinase n=2 Tax=Psychromonas marina TaxID=88364 RepID=A0ABQ6DZS2_9GAMM|nr:diacylglycerol kinase [Psychromonas marina]